MYIVTFPWVDLHCTTVAVLISTFPSILWDSSSDPDPLSWYVIDKPRYLKSARMYRALENINIMKKYRQQNIFFFMKHTVT